LDGVCKRDDYKFIENVLCEKEIATMSREGKILYHINKKGWGIEIGPSYNPIAPKRNGYKVHIIDHMDRAQLIEKYKNEGVQLANIEDVDFVWKGESYSELTGKKKFYDWIIASHLIEHTPDLIGFLINCDEVMRDDAIISLAIPDKRYCFDHFRPITGISKIIDSYFQKNRVHTPGALAESLLNSVSKAGSTAWGSKHRGEYAFLNSLDYVREIINKSVENGNKYIDNHSWCFTPHSFRLIVHDLYSLGLIPFKEVSFIPTHGCEFYITLGRKGKGIGYSRLDILKVIESELNTMQGIVKNLFHRLRWG